jgi:flagellar motor protein MotB
MTPYLSENNRTLYFASDRWDSSGGLDIYMTRREGDSWFDWSSPIQFIEPINSKADESQPYFNMTTGYLYFTSKRDGNSDIFKVSIAPPQPTEMVVKGRVIHSKTRFQLTDCAVAYFFEGTERQIIPAPDGTFTIKIPKGVPVYFTGIKTGFNGVPQEVFFRQDYYYFKDFYNIELEVDPLEKGMYIALQPIFFQQSKATILDNSFGELKKLADLLTQNPSIHILIEGHTDNIGKAEDLIQLSLDRADAVKAFLIDQGIEERRIETKGVGPKSPLNDNSSDELRQLNRRVEILITRT